MSVTSTPDQSDNYNLWTLDDILRKHIPHCGGNLYAQSLHGNSQANSTM